MFLIITPLIAAILALIYVKISFNVIKNRRKNKVAYGDGGIDNLSKAIRAHGNFIEYSPLVIILIVFLELNHFNPLILLAIGLIFIIGRVIHFKAMTALGDKGNLKLRVLGMQITFITIISLSLLNLIQIFRLF